MGFPDRSQDRYVSKYHNSNAKTSQENNAKPFQGKNVETFQDRYHNSNVEMYPDSSAIMFHASNVETFPENNVKMCLGSNVVMNPDNGAEVFQNRSVRMFQDNNVGMFPDKYVPKQAMVARNLYHAFDKIINYQLVINTSPVSLLPYQIYTLCILMSSFGLKYNLV